MLGLLKYDEAITELYEMINQCDGEPKSTETKDPTLVKMIKRPKNLQCPVRRI